MRSILVGCMIGRSAGFSPYMVTGLPKSFRFDKAEAAIKTIAAVHSQSCLSVIVGRIHVVCFAARRGRHYAAIPSLLSAIAESEPIIPEDLPSATGQLSRSLWRRHLRRFDRAAHV